MIVIDLKVGSARAGLTVRTAAIWSAIWVALSIAFGIVLWASAGAEAGEGYFAGDVMERLSTSITLAVIIGVLAVSIGACIRAANREGSAGPSTATPERQPIG